MDSELDSLDSNVTQDATQDVTQDEIQTCPSLRRWAIAVSLVVGVGTTFGLTPGTSIPGWALERLDAAAIAQESQAIPSWTVVDQTLVCTYEFADFVESIAFVNQLVEPAESLGHHPDLMISYNRVRIELTTHDAGGLTQLDFDLATRIAEMSDRPCVMP